MKDSLISLCLLLIASTVVGFRCQKSSNSAAPQPDDQVVRFAATTAFDSPQVDRILKKLAAAPHPLGSERQSQMTEFLQQEAAAMKLDVYLDSFTAKVPNPDLLGQEDASGPVAVTLERQGTNIIAIADKGHSCTYFFGSHYDTKYITEFTYRGANDSGSSSAALFWLLQAAQTYSADHSLECNLGAIWFDGEEAYLPNWSDGETRHPAKTQDNTYGSRHLAGRLTPCAQDETALCLPQALSGHQFSGLILLDMIGSPNIRLTPDSHSKRAWLELAMELAAALDMPQLFANQSPRGIEDDHIPFLNRGLPVINLIDFQHLSVWHRPGDDVSAVSLSSIEQASRLALALSLTLAQSAP